MASIVGRERELATLSALLRGAAEGPARIAWLEGEAGIGKTTLLLRTLEEAAAAGATVFTGRGEPFEQERVFGAIARALGVGLSANDVGSPYVVVDRLYDRIEDHAVRGPVVVGLDDVQWFDPWSARAVGIIFRRARALPLAFVLASRPTPRTEEVATLASTVASEVTHVPVGPLQNDEVASIVHDRAGEAGPKLRAHLARAGGNPFFVSELFDALDRDGALERGTDAVELRVAGIPASLRMSILHRLHALPPDAHALLRPAATLGGSFTPDELRAVAGVDVVEPADVLRAEGVFRDDGDERLAFRHDLIRETIYEDMGVAAREASHRLAAKRLASIEADPITVAHHTVLGAERGDAEAARSLIEAARDKRLSLGDSARFLERALDIKPPEPDDWKLRIALANALHAADQPVRAREIADPLLEERTDPVERLQIFGVVYTAALRARSPDRELILQRFIKLGEQLRDTNDPHALIRVARTRFFVDRQESLAIAERAAELARASGDRVAEAEAENMCGWLNAGLGRSRKGVAHTDAVIETGYGRVPMYMLHRSGTLRADDRFDAAERALADGRAVAEELGEHSVLLKLMLEEARLLLSRGRLDDAVLIAETAQTLAREAGIFTDGQDPAHVLAHVAIARGDLDAAERALDEGLDIGSIDSEMNVTRMLIGLSRGDRDEALAHARELAWSHAGADWWDIVVHAVDVLVELGDGEGAAQMREHLESHTEFHSPSALLAIARVTARVANDRAAAERAVALADESPRLLSRAHTYASMAKVLGDETLRARAVEIFEQVGATGFADRARAVKARKTRAARPVTGWDALTRAEHEVVMLAAEGLTNKQIGERLFVSHRTVATHLAHAFDKLQMRSRVELARAAAARAASQDRTTGT